MQLYQLQIPAINYKPTCRADWYRTKAWLVHELVEVLHHVFYFFGQPNVIKGGLCFGGTYRALPKKIVPDATMER